MTKVTTCKNKNRITISKKNIGIRKIYLFLSFITNKIILPMKKIIISIFILLAVSTCFAQKNRISGGLYAKGGVSWLTSDSKKIFTNEKAKLSYGFGATMDVNFANNFSFNISAGFCNLGGIANFKYGTESFQEVDGYLIGGPSVQNYKYSTSYIEVPIGIRGCTNEIGYLTYFLKIGADPMVRIKAKVSPGLESYVSNKTANLFNVGWFVGGGFEWAMVGNTRLLVEIDYMGTLVDLDKIKAFKNEYRNESTNPRIKINDVSLKVGVLF